MMQSHRTTIIDAGLAVVLAVFLILGVRAQLAPAPTFIPLVARSSPVYPHAVYIPASYVLDGVDPLYVDGVLYVAVQTISPADGHPKVAVVFKEQAIGLTPVITVTAIYGGPHLLLAPDGRLLVAGSDRANTLHLVEVPRD